MKPVNEYARLLDDKPWAAHLYVTDQCNLDCHYCNEYDNSVPHPELEQLKTWMRKIRSLGVMRLGLQGGEPIMHPDIVEIVRYAKELGFVKVSMSSNALLLTQELAQALGNAGLDAFQFSVDRMTPTKSTRKSFKSVKHKLRWFDGTPTRVQVAGVLFEDTIGQMEQVIEHCKDQGINAHARVVHDDLINGKAAQRGPDLQPMMDFINWESDRKGKGETIHSSWNILKYQKQLLRGEDADWTCAAGYKYFFVSAQGKFWLCSQVRTEMDLMDITPETLLAYNNKKDCQSGCGVYCTVDMSLAVSHPVKYLSREAKGEIKARLHLLGEKLRGGERQQPQAQGA